jgi:hypothetical protein
MRCFLVVGMLTTLTALQIFLVPLTVIVVGATIIADMRVLNKNPIRAVGVIAAFATIIIALNGNVIPWHCYITIDSY